MLDASLPLTVIEYDEWGNPHEAEAYSYIRSYSPYDNIVAQDYPHMLVTAGLNDPRVAYWEPAKWTAKLRAMKTDNNRLLLRTNMGAGHGGASGRYEFLREIAFKHAFVLDVLGME
jgi:oligopeptidase B